MLHFKVLVTKNGHESRDRAFLGISFYPIVYGFSEPPRVLVDRKTWLNAKSGHLKNFYSESIDIFSDFGHFQRKFCVKKTNTFLLGSKMKICLIETVLYIEIQLFYEIDFSNLTRKKDFFKQFPYFWQKFVLRSEKPKFLNFKRSPGSLVFFSSKQTP